MFDTRVHDDWNAPDTPAARSLLESLADARRRENQSAAKRLRIAAELFEMRRAERGEAADWAVDTWAAVGAEIAAALSISLGRAGSALNYGLAMRRLPAVAAVFEAGDIDLDLYRVIVFRTGLVDDPDATAHIDRLIAARAARWPSMTRGAMAREIDRLVHQVDRDAVRRSRERARDRDVTVWESADGTADISGRLFATDARLLDKKLDALAATVCEADPRTKDQRRADALGALAGGAERLMCRCADPRCPATAKVAPAVVVTVLAEQATLDGRSEKPAYLLGADTLIPAELLREIAAQARLRPLIHPGQAPAEPRYRPSRALADFVRARDLTCRAPGCDRPATECDLDHTVPYNQGGPTQASNIKALCRTHHILKTFGGWHDRQLADGTVIWDLPDGQMRVTLPGSALLFPALSVQTADPPATPPRQRPDLSAVPLRTTKRSRSQNRAHRIAAERAANRRRRLGRTTAAVTECPPPSPGDEPPPF